MQHVTTPLGLCVTGYDKCLHNDDPILSNRSIYIYCCLFGPLGCVSRYGMEQNKY